MRLISTTHIKSLARKGERPVDVAVRKGLFGSAVEIGERVLRFTISTANPDRENDVVALDGWDLTAYRRNPVVLWAHEQHCLPIGRGFDLDIEDGALKASVEFVAADVPHVGDKAEAIFRLCKDGFISATSVGFRPIEYDVATSRDDGEGWFPPINYLRQELLEFSIVTVPANAEALIEIGDEVPSAAVPEPVIPANDDVAEQAARAVRNQLVRSARDRRLRQVQVLGLI